MRGPPGAAALVLLLAAPALSLEQPGTTAASSLQIPMGSRALGMGGAFTAVANDPSALAYNPAGLSLLSAHELSATFMSGQADDSQQHYAYGGPIPFAGLAGEGFSSVGGSFMYSRAGEIELNELNSDGTLKRTATLSAGYDLVATAGYAERVGATPIDAGGRPYNISHYLGLAGKIVHSKLAERWSATAAAGDAGYLAVCPDLNLALGFSALNIGTRMRFVLQNEPLPMTFRMGLAWGFKPAPLHDLLFAADGDFLYYDRLWHASAGLEYFWNRSFGFRLGYQFNRQTLGITAGLGYRWKSRFSADYAWAMGSAVSDAHRVTFGYRFGGVVPSAREKGRRPFMEVTPGRESLPVAPEIAPEPPRKRPKAGPRDDSPTGVPGWIY